MYANNAYNTYKNNSVNFASKEQLLLMLVDGAVKFSKLSKKAIELKDFSKAHENLVKTQNIFVELMATLDTTSNEDWTKQIMAVYEFIHSRLIEANLKKDIKIIDEVIPLIENVRDTWYEAYKVSKKAK